MRLDCVQLQAGFFADLAIVHPGSQQAQHKLLLSRQTDRFFFQTANNAGIGLGGFARGENKLADEIQ